MGRSGKLPRGDGVLCGAAWLPVHLGSGSWVWVGHIGRMGRQLCCSGLSMASPADGLPRPHAPVSTWFLALFLVTMKWVLTWLKSSLRPSFRLKSCQLCSHIPSFLSSSLDLLLDLSLLEVGPSLVLQGLEPIPNLRGIPDTTWAVHRLPAPPRLCPLTAVHCGSSLMLTARPQQKAYGQTSFLPPPQSQTSTAHYPPTIHW